MGKDGQRRWSATEARVALERWQASGLTLAAYCRQRGLRAQRLARWRQRLGWEGEDEAEGGRGPGSTWVEATVMGLGAGAAVVVHVGGGARIEVGEVERVEPAWVATLARLLAASG